MDLQADIIGRHFTTFRGELLIGGVPVSRIAETYGTPLFVYDRAIIENKLAQLRAALPERFSIFYSVKANPTQAILQLFVGARCGLEVASAGEFCRAAMAGCPPAQIMFAGPGKTEAELQSVLSHGIGMIHVESETELQRIAAISRELGVISDIGLRVNPGADAEGGAMRMGGRPAPFGIDEEALAPVVSRICAEPQIRLRGIHLFTGTQILDAGILLGQYRHALRIGAGVARHIGHPLESVDFGGGLGVPYFPADTALDLQQLGGGLRQLMAEVQSDPWLADTRFVVEPGRFLVAESGVYVTRVVDIKVSRGKRFLIVDGGMNHHLAASGNLGQTIKRNFPMALANRLDGAAEALVDVVGPLCTPLDVLGRGVALPEAEIGDLVTVFQSGAYARSASPLAFLSHPEPVEVLVQDHDAVLIRARGEYDQYARACQPLPAREVGAGRLNK